MAEPQPLDVLQRQSVGVLARPKKGAKTVRSHAPTPLVAQHQKFTVRVHYSCSRGDAHAILHSAFNFFVRDHLRTVATPSTSVGLCSPGRPCVKHWWKGAATLQMSALHAIGTASNPPATLAIESAPYSSPVDVLTVCSAPVNRVQSESVCGPIFSMSIGLQRLWPMPPRGLGMD